MNWIVAVVLSIEDEFIFLLDKKKTCELEDIGLTRLTIKIPDCPADSQSTNFIVLIVHSHG